MERIKKGLKELYENWLIYAVTIAAGVPIGVGVESEKMVQALLVIGTVILTALIATLLVPFAGFSLNERWQKLAVQYGAVPTFGTYGALLYRWAGWPAMLLVLPPLLVHAGYWQSSMHSRSYRLELYKLGFANQLPHTTRLIAVLSAKRMQHIADRIICDLLDGAKINLAQSCPELQDGWHHLSKCAEQELAAEQQRMSGKPAV